MRGAWTDCNMYICTYVTTYHSDTAWLPGDKDISGGEVCGGTCDRLVSLLLFVCILSSHMVSALRPMIQL